MISEWKKTKISDVASFQNGYAFKSKDFLPNGQYKVIRIKELKDGQIIFSSDTAYINCELSGEFEKYAVKNGDVLFSLTGDPVNKNNPLSWVGRVAVYQYNKKSLLNQRLCKLIPSKEINPTYLYYYFRVFENFYSLASKATGSANQANISTKTIGDELILLPNRQLQDKIVSILLSLDDKIKLNNQINKNLEV